MTPPVAQTLYPSAFQGYHRCMQIMGSVLLIIQTREKGQQNQESSQLEQRDKSTKSVQETVINKTVSNQGSKGVNTIQGKTGKSHG